MKTKNIKFEGKVYIVSEDLKWWRMATVAKNIKGGNSLYSTIRDLDPHIEEELVTLVNDAQFMNVEALKKNIDLIDEYARHRPQKITSKTVLDRIDKVIKAQTISVEVEEELLPIKEELDALQAKIERIAKAKVEKNLYKDELEKAKKVIEELRETNLRIANENRALKNENNALKVFKSEVTKLLETR